jgi:hypothetical protein
MTRVLPCLLLGLLLDLPVLGLTPATVAWSADSEPVAAGPWVGFGGVYRTGSWTPLTIDLPDDWPAGEGPVYASVEDPDGQWLASPSADVERVGGRAVARFCVRFGRPSGRVLLHRAPLPTDAIPVMLPPPIPSTEMVLLTLGEPAGLDRAARLLAREDGSRPRVVVAPRGPLPLAATPRDLDGADLVLACGRDLLARDAGTLEAIDAWIRRGGRLILMAGSSAADVAARGEPASEWLPGPVSRMVPLRRSAPLEVFANCTRPMDRGLLAGLRVPVFANAREIDGLIEAHDGAKASDLPLVVRRGHGLGVISWIAADLDRAGFRSWPGSDTLLVELLGGPPRAQAGRAGETGRLALDLAGQLRRAIDRFPGIAPVPFAMVALLGGLAIASLYPASWWLVRQASPGVAWAVLPAISLLTGWGVWEGGRAWQRGGPGESAASVIDIDAAGAAVRGLSWGGCWSPENGLIDVAAVPTAAVAGADPEIAVSWYADAGRGLGATDAVVPHPPLAVADYAYGPTAATLSAVPIAASSSRLFEAEWTADLAEVPVSATLAVEAQGTLRGEVVHHLPFPLERCVLMHAGWLYTIGRLEPGEVFDPSKGRGPRSLTSALTRRTQDKDRDVVTRWETESTDIAQILEIAGFHAAAGGSSYTSLEPGRLARLDLSPQLEAGRAVLVGFGPAGTAWSFGRRDAETTADPSSGVTMWRILMPLQLGGTGGDP